LLITKIMYSEKEIKAIKGELLSELISICDTNYEITEYVIDLNTQELLRSFLILGDEKSLEEKLKNIISTEPHKAESKVYLYYKTLLELSGESGKDILKLIPYDKKEKDYQYSWFCFDLARLKLMKDLLPEAGVLLVEGLKTAPKNFDDYFTALRLLSIYFEKSNDLVGAFIFLKSYLNRRNIAVRYLDEKMIAISIQLFKNKELPFKNRALFLLEAVETLGPDHGKKLFDYLNKNIGKFSKEIVDLEMRLKRAQKNFHYHMQFVSNDPLNDIYVFLKSKKEFAGLVKDLQIQQ